MMLSVPDRAKTIQVHERDAPWFSRFGRAIRLGIVSSYREADNDVLSARPVGLAWVSGTSAGRHSYS